MVHTIPLALERLRQEDSKLETSPSYRSESLPVPLTAQWFKDEKHEGITGSLDAGAKLWVSGNLHENVIHTVLISYHCTNILVR